MQRVVVLSDIMVDYHIHERLFVNGLQSAMGEPCVSGTGFNAALALKMNGVNVCILGAIGEDSSGVFVRDVILASGMNSVLITVGRRTPTFHMIISARHDEMIRLSLDEIDNSNNLSIEEIEKLLTEACVIKGEFIFITAHFLLRRSGIEVGRILRLYEKMGLRIILDIVPHDIYRFKSAGDIVEILKGKVHLLISELFTMSRISGLQCNVDRPELSDLSAIFRLFNPRRLMLSYGAGNNDANVVLGSHGDEVVILREVLNTGFSSLSALGKKGFGDAMMAEYISSSDLLCGLN